MDNMLEFVTTNIDLIAVIVTVFGIIITFLVAFQSFNKQRNLSINRERLDIVYFPLVTAMNSYKGSGKAFNLYWYLHDQIEDEKYRTLIDSNKVISCYLDLKDYFSSTNNKLDQQAESHLFYKLKYTIEE